MGGDTSSHQRLFFTGRLVQTKRLFWDVIYQRLLLLTSSARPRLGLAGRTEKEERKRAATGYPPLVNSKVNTVERERKEVYLRLEVRCLQMSSDA